VIETSTERSSNLPSDTFSRRLRWLELALVLAVAFALPVLSSFYLLFSKQSRSVEYSDARLVSAIIIQALALAVMFYVVFRQGRRLAELGLSWNLNRLAPQVLWAIGLALFAMFASFFTRRAMAETYFVASGHQLNFRLEKLPNISVSFVTFVFIVLNGWFEELIVRAFAITEMEALTRNTTLAVAFSVLFQTSYHFYQGVPQALSYIPIFLIFSIFYVRKRDIVPVALAHVLIDLISVFVLQHRH